MKSALIAIGNEESYGLLIVGGELLRYQQAIKFFDAEDETVVEKVCGWAPDFIFFSPMTTFYPKALSLSRQIKERLPQVTAIFGGHHAMSAPEICTAEPVTKE